eukprot:gene8872-8039_t
MKPSERRMLYKYWVTQAKAWSKGAEYSGTLLARYQDALQQLQQVHDCCDRDLCSGAKVIGLTTSGCAQHRGLLQALNAPVVICEEAGEVFESHLLCCLSPSTQHVILIGDHMQLRPKVSSYKLSVENRSSGYAYDISTFERLVDYYHGLGERDSILSTLTVQRRMHPEISSLIRRTLYPALTDHASVGQHPAMRGLVPPHLWFFDHCMQECGGDSGEHSNEGEADLAVQLVRYFVKQGYRSEEVALITPYVGQLLLLRRKLGAQHCVLNERDRQDLLDQGEDADDDGGGPDAAQGEVAPGQARGGAAGEAAT